MSDQAVIIPAAVPSPTPLQGALGGLADQIENANVEVDRLGKALHVVLRPPSEPDVDAAIVDEDGPPKAPLTHELGAQADRVALLVERIHALTNCLDL